MTMAELAVMIPKSGGQYVFARRALGEYPAFVIGWTDWVSTCGATAATAIALGELATEVSPRLAGHESITAIVVTLAFMGVQWVGVRSGDRAQQLLSLMKGIALLAVAAACFTVPAARVADQFVPNIPTGLAFVSALVFVFQNVLYTYDGWNGLTYFGGEVRDPGREIPRAMALGVIAIAGRVPRAERCVSARAGHWPVTQATSFQLRRPRTWSSAARAAGWCGG
jgi:APA family basic amino acid/polyamine antiporter